MSGIGKNLPPPNFDWWPIPPPGSPPAGSEIKVPTLQEAVDSVAEMPLVAPPYTFPVYSNAGFSMLGGSITAAVSKAEGKDITYPDLMERDIFKPLGMNGSSFAASEGNYAHLAIPSIGTDVVGDAKFVNSSVLIIPCKHRT
jgi:CubicO group peptidase (beta-lactamase class C family)